MHNIKKSPLSDFYAEKAYMVEFAGFYMPLFYKSILDEHMAVREHVGLFDVSHMGRIIVEGEDATDFVNYLTANDVNRLVEGKSHYSLFLNNQGGIVDDILVYRLDKDMILIVFNASNRDKDYRWILKHKNGFDSHIRNISDNTVMFAVQGPDAIKVISNFYPQASSLKRFYFEKFEYDDLNGWISRTGYTGEDGFEIILFFDNIKHIKLFWKELEQRTISLSGLPCGLGARDSLRLEAGYCLYGNDINENTNPFEANLSWVVKMDQGDFIGKKALSKLRDNVKRLRVGIVMNDRSIPRSHYKILNDDMNKVIGEVTSGGFSPILKRGIGMGYIDVEYSSEDTSIRVDIRGKLKQGAVKAFPLYDKSRYGFRRMI